MTPDAKTAMALFMVWREDQTGDTWPQLSESERGAWLRVASFVLDTAAKVMLSSPYVELPQQ